jgi:hypothetical protein
LFETITTSIFFLKFKENNENDMAAHAICFGFSYQHKPNQIRQNSCRVPAVTCSLGKCILSLLKQ